MAQQQMARICKQCEGWYDSERELRDHMQAAHRRFASEQSTFQRGGMQPDSFKNQLKARVGQPLCTAEEPSPSPLRSAAAKCAGVGTQGPEGVLE